MADEEKEKAEKMAAAKKRVGNTFPNVLLLCGVTVVHAQLETILYFFGVVEFGVCFTVGFVLMWSQ